MYGHDYEVGHTCSTCGKSGILCTIEDGFCENDGDCDDCIKERVYEKMRREEADSWACRHGFHESEDCPLCEHVNGEHDIEYTGEDWSGPEYTCPLCANPELNDRDATNILKGQLGG